MPNFTAPDLVTDLSITQYRSQLNENFRLIEAALVQIQNAIPSISGASVGQSNLTWIERALLPEGMIGVDSFFPSFSTDQDTLIVEHRQDGGYSSCVIGGLYHQTQEIFERAFGDIIVSDGTWPVVLAVKSNGYPSLEMQVVVEDTDNDYDLPLYRMDVTRAGSVWAVRNLRRVADLILDQGLGTRVLDADVPLAFGFKGQLGTGTGQRACGVIAPWDMEISGGYARLETAPTQTDGIEIEFRRGEPGTDAENVFTGAAAWTNGQSGDVVHLSANSPMTKVSAGEFIYAHVTVGEAVAVASDLFVTILARRIWHPIYR